MTSLLLSRLSLSDSGLGSNAPKLESSANRHRELFESVLDVTKETTPPSMEKTLKKIEEVKAALAPAHLFFEKERKRFKTSALTLANQSPLEKSKESNLIEALSLEPLEMAKRKKTLETPLKYIESENAESAFQTIDHVEGILSSVKIIQRPDVFPLMWEYTKECLATLNIQLKETGRILGTGAEGDVIEVSYKGNLGALKKYSNANYGFGPGKGFTRSQNEASLSLVFGHPNIISPLLVTPSSILYLKADSDLFSLFSSIRKNKTEIDPDDLKALFCKIAEGLAHMHKKHYVHRDIKPENILLLKRLAGTFSPLISDLSFTCTIGDQDNLLQKQGTPLYFSKELAQAYFNTTLLDSKSYKAADVYAFGMMIFKLLRKQQFHSPFVNPKNDPKGMFFKDKKTTLEAKLKKRANFPNLTKEHLESLLDPALREKLDPENVLFNLMCDCLQDEPRRRPTMELIGPRLS